MKMSKKTEKKANNSTLNESIQHIQKAFINFKYEALKDDAKILEYYLEDSINFSKFETIDKYSTTLLGDCITSSFLVLRYLKLHLNTTVSYIEGYFDVIDSKSKQYKQEYHVIPCFIHKLDGTPAILSLIDVPLKYCLQLILGKVGVNLVGQEFL
jgi:hypothetical protein